MRTPCDLLWGGTCVCLVVVALQSHCVCSLWCVEVSFFHGLRALAPRRCLAFGVGRNTFTFAFRVTHCNIRTEVPLGLSRIFAWADRG